MQNGSIGIWSYVQMTWWVEVLLRKLNAELCEFMSIITQVSCWDIIMDTRISVSCLVSRDLCWEEQKFRLTSKFHGLLQSSHVTYIGQAFLHFRQLAEHLKHMWYGSWFLDHWKNKWVLLCNTWLWVHGHHLLRLTLACFMTHYGCCIDSCWSSI